MKIAIMSDVHGNYDSFQQAISYINNQKVDVLFFLGDLVGYYYESLLIIDELMKLENLVIVLGNHDYMFLEMYNSKNKQLIRNYRKKYGSSFDEFFVKVSKDQINFLASIPISKKVEIDGVKFVLIHGGPSDPLYQRIYPDTLVDDFNVIDADVVLLGHTHYRMNRVDGSKVIINPGSLGQPRDGKAASFVIYDTTTKESVFVDVEFDIIHLKEQVKSRSSEPSYLINVLNRIIG